MARCPICHSIIGTWKEDPLTPQKPPRYYHIIELRDRVNNLETTIGLSPTVWKETMTATIPVRYYHIIELREAIVGILNSVGVSLSDYLNKDETGYDYGTGRTNWIDPTIVTTTPARWYHIEDLRRQFMIALMETWSPAESKQYHIGDEIHGVAKDYWVIYQLRGDPPDINSSGYAEISVDKIFKADSGGWDYAEVGLASKPLSHPTPDIFYNYEITTHTHIKLDYVSVMSSLGDLWNTGQVVVVIYYQDGSIFWGNIVTSVGTFSGTFDIAIDPTDIGKKVDFLDIFAYVENVSWPAPAVWATLHVEFDNIQIYEST